MINQLTDDIIRLNEMPAEKDSISESASNIWTNLTLFFKGNSEEAILDACKNAEKDLYKEYEETLKYTSITDSTRAVLDIHKEQIASSITDPFEI